MFSGPAASGRWAVRRLSADYTTRRLEPIVFMWPGGFAPLGSTAAAVSRLYTAASELLFMWPGGFAPLGSTAALSRLYTAACELLFMWPGGFAPLGSMAALSRLYNTAV